MRRTKAEAKETRQQILLAAPTSSDERVAQLLRETRGYLYYVSFAGVTGAAGLDIASVGRRLASVRQGSSTPVAVGFGVRDAASARGVADGIASGPCRSRIASVSFAGRIGAASADAAAARCVELGATRPDEQPGESWRVLLDPSGHPFCLTQAANWG